MLYTREGVAPLFYMNPGELKQLRDFAAQKAKEKMLHTDKRFMTLADPVIRPAENDDDFRKYLIVIGLQLGVIDRVAVDGHLNGRLSVRLADGAVEYSSVRDVQEALAGNSGMLDDVVDRVNHEMQTIAPASRVGEVQSAMLRAIDLHREASASHQPAEARWWERAVRVLNTRMHYGQYFVN